MIRIPSIRLIAEGRVRTGGRNHGRASSFAPIEPYTLTGPFEVWADIIQGKAEGGQMFMEGSYKVEGNFYLMMVFGKK